MFRFNKMLYYETVAYLSLCQLSQMYNSSSLCVCERTYENKSAYSHESHNATLLSVLNHAEK
jgi:hypothetical protein